MTSLSSGTVTFLFTDVEGSFPAMRTAINRGNLPRPTTSFVGRGKLLELSGDLDGASTARHHALLDASIELVIRLDDHERAATLVGVQHALATRHHLGDPETEHATTLAAELGDDAFAAAVSRGRELSEGDARRLLTNR